jgi:hypothetical protein
MRYLPYVLAVVALAGFTAYQGVVTDRWRENVEAEACAQLLEQVPKKIGDWVGEDQPVEERIRKTAGAEGYVSRLYTNSKTKEKVDVWFIVGHSFNVWRHTPNVCYRAQGFTQDGREIPYKIEVEGREPATFFTGVFRQGPNAKRVFWTWTAPVTEPGEKTEWIAPTNSSGQENARRHFGNLRALYKLYFTAGVGSDDEKPEDSVCVDFAQEFLPIANKVLEQGAAAPATAEAAPAPASPAPAAG